MVTLVNGYYSVVRLSDTKLRFTTDARRVNAAGRWPYHRSFIETFWLSYVKEGLGDSCRFLLTSRYLLKKYKKHID